MKKLNVLAVGSNIDQSLLGPMKAKLELKILDNPDQVNRNYEAMEVIIWSNNLPLNSNSVKHLKNLKYIINWGTNSNNIQDSLKASEKYSFFYINDYATNTVAKFGYDKFRENTKGNTKDLKVGIIGLGKIGYTLASMLKSQGVENISYAAKEDKNLDSLIFKRSSDLFKSCDFIFITTSSGEKLQIPNLVNPKLTIINLCSDSLFSLEKIKKLVESKKLVAYLSDNKQPDLEINGAIFYGKVAYKSTQSTVNKHNKLLYFLKIIYMNKFGEVQSVYLDRHGETFWNLEGIYQGRLDSSLTPKGVEQTDRKAAFFTDKSITAIHTSPLGRAKQTANRVGAALGIKPKIHGFLREQDFGSLQGMPKDEARKVHAGFFESRSSNPWSKLYTPYPGGGESYFDVYDRVHDEYLALLAESEGNVVFFGHESINRILRGITKGLEAYEMVQDRQANNQIVEINLRDMTEGIIEL